MVWKDTRMGGSGWFAAMPLRTRNALDVAADGGGVFHFAWVAHLYADEELLRRMDFGVGCIDFLARLDHRLEREVRRDDFGAYGDLRGLFAIDRMEDFVVDGS